MQHLPLVDLYGPPVILIGVWMLLFAMLGYGLTRLEVDDDR